MKRWKVAVLVIVFIVIGINVYLVASGYGNKLYMYYNHNGVLDYGKQLSIYQILGDDIDISKYPELGEYKYKKANVKSMGNTTCINIKIDKLVKRIYLIL